VSRKSKTFLLFAICLAVTSATSAFLLTNASPESPAPKPQVDGPRPNTRGPRNLHLRPEAFSVSRQLGNRFRPSSRAVSTFVGSLTIGKGEQPVRIVRRQTETGETVELQIGENGLRWSEREGIGAGSGVPTDTERLLAERLIQDSPDQFVLAQLRGASYFTVARNVRPAEAGDDYSGPLWNLVRVDEPQQDESLRPQSTWRIYYINVQTGLPDRVEYQLNGRDILAEMVEWTEQNGEKTPSHMRWSSDGQIVMEYRGMSVSHNQ
jgi:hypothetical protein